MKKIVIFSIILFFSLITVSYATAINFRSNDFSFANNQPSFYYSPFGLWITAHPENAVLYQDSTDGLGIKHDYENDEIEESLLQTCSMNLKTVEMGGLKRKGNTALMEESGLILLLSKVKYQVQMVNSQYFFLKQLLYRLSSFRQKGGKIVDFKTMNFHSDRSI